VAGCADSNHSTRGANQERESLDVNNTTGSLWTIEVLRRGLLRTRLVTLTLYAKPTANKKDPGPAPEPGLGHPGTRVGSCPRLSMATLAKPELAQHFWNEKGILEKT
jgi:hypothetical protein